MRIALAQIDPTVGDVAGNAALIERWIDRARAAGAELVVFPELAISGYPPRDLVLVEGFVGACAAAAKEVGERATAGITAVFGCPLPADREDPSGGTANSLLVYRDNAFVDFYDKRLLPTYDVFDEDRYFTPGERACVVDVNGTMVGLAVCEDLWRGEDAGFSSRYRRAADPVAEAVAAGAQVLAVPSASPFVLGKNARHRHIVAKHARTHGIPVASVNQVGGNDDLIFDGHACCYDARGTLIAAAEGFTEDLLVFDTNESAPVPDPIAEADDERLVIEALTVGVRDYVHTCGFTKAVIGLSGGIDSALTAAIGVRALGADNVIGASMPGRFSSDHSKADAFELAHRLDITCVTMPIEPAHQGLAQAINPAFSEIGMDLLGESLPDVTQENLQSRVRGALIMALSNRTGALVLTTGNKSELAVGYCTLYGDMNGGLAVLADLPKTMVFRISRYINEHARELGFSRPPIPVSTIEKPPSAELAPGQLDSDSLPAYEILDEIVERHVERLQSAAKIIDETGFDEAVVRRICRLIDINEYKRQQLATGLKVTSTAFGRGRRMPIAQKWTR